MVGHICVAWDDSPRARWTLAFAGRLARATAARLTIVHVEPPTEHELLELGSVGRARRLLPAAAASVPATVEVSVRVLTGRPAEQLVAFARAEDVDVLVAATRPARLRRELLASAPCPVMLVPPIVMAVRDRSLLWQLFVAEALVLTAALLVLVLAPIQISTTVVVTEVLLLSAGLAIMLAVHLLVLRRTLAPLRRLTHVVGALDARDPGRLPADARTVEVNALAEAFNGLLDRLDEEQRRSARRALVAQEDERLRIAREMHDQIGQSLTALTIQAERGAETEGPIDPALLDRIAQTALQSLEDVRRIGRELRPEALDDLGLGNALIALCRRLGTPTGVRVTHTLEPGLPELGPDVDLVVYRIAQEAITNALRHAGATTIDVRLERAAGGVELTVADDGRGLPAALPDDTAGISGMHERAALVGASLHIGGDDGTVVRLRVPG
jgi:two-component system sensor histidine kinase UhpB